MEHLGIKRYSSIPLTYSKFNSFFLRYDSAKLQSEGFSADGLVFPSLLASSTLQLLNSLHLNKIIMRNSKRNFLFYATALCVTGNNYNTYSSLQKRMHCSSFYLDNQVLLPSFTQQITRAINSVGSECYLDKVEVTGSNPVWPTKKAL